MCRDVGSVETGGILVGRYSLDLKLAIVREATPPPSDSRRGRTWFNRGVAGLREMLAQRWRAKDRTHYLGEWHFHPVPSVVPSADDFLQMVQIAHNSEYQCREPLLVIVGAKKIESDRAVRAFVCPTSKSPMELIAIEERPSGPEPV